MYELTGQIFSQLDAALLLRGENQEFWLPAPPPVWWLDYSGIAEYGPDHPCDIVARDPFLTHFLVDAQQHWDQGHNGHIRSGIWEVELPSGEKLSLEAFALKVASQDLLMIEDVRSAQSATTKGIQRGRTSKLEMLRDIARRQQLEIELRDARNTAEQLERAKTQLLANTSHELRTPLAGMIGMLEIASETNESAELDAALRSAKQLKRIVHDLLDFSALETGNAHLAISHFNVATLLFELHRQFDPAAAEKGLCLIFDSPGDAEVWLTSDHLRLRQILSNLIDNALRYTDEGEVALLLSEDDTAIEIHIKDTGPGISSAEQQTIFDVFGRGSSSDIHDGGTGLGLAIAQRLANRLGGNLTIAETGPHGTTFSLQMPRRLVDPLPSRPSEHNDGGSVELPAGLKILVAEDSPINREYLVRLLGKQNADVDEVDNGLDLINRTNQFRYDVILTDYRMVGMTGVEVADQLRRQKLDVPIIAITAHATAQETIQLKEAGIDDILLKPYSKEELLRTILAHLPSNI